MGASYNGHSSYNAWNVSLWINNDEGLYNLAREAVRRTRTRQEAAQYIVDSLKEFGITETPDGVKYGVTNVRKALVEFQ